MIEYNRKDDKINGITLSAKNKDFVIQIWNKNCEAEKKDLENMIRGIAGVESSAIFYKLCKQPRGGGKGK